MLNRSDLLILCELPEMPYWLCTFIFGLFALGFLYACYRSISKARSIQDTPTSKIRSAAQGYVELVGTQKASPQLNLTAKLTHKPCTWYRYKIERYHTQEKKWTILESGVSPYAFCIDDGTGICYVDPQLADISTPITEVWYGRTRYPKPKPRGFWANLFVGSGGLYRYTEMRMEPNMHVYACGNFLTLTQSQIDSPHQSKHVEQLLKSWKKYQPTLLHFLHAEDKSLKSATIMPKITDHLTPSINILSNKGLDSRQPFIISAHSENQIVTRYKWDAAIWALAFVGTFALTYFLIRLRTGC